ncbi:MAG: hypothetical protein WC341_05820 [Bacteroidales bacterium]|jgi:hypothetical protein
MKTEHELIIEINGLTLFIEEQFPELIKYLNEQPITIPNSEMDTVGIESLIQYRDALQSMLNRYSDSHQTPDK